MRAHYVGHYVLVYVDAEGSRRLTLPSAERITERDRLGGPTWLRYVMGRLTGRPGGPGQGAGP